MTQMTLEVSLPRSKRDVVTGSEEQLRPSFARHETFHPRHGWLKKGFDRVLEYPDVFIRPDATVLLGVGKNMVRSIRYWCNAFKVVGEHPDPARPRMRIAAPTEFGQRLLAEEGWDPYLENQASLWLLHWALLQPTCTAPSWYAAFNVFDAVEFTDLDLLRSLREFRDSQPGWDGIVDASVKKDVSCLLRMYAGGLKESEARSEEALDSPFVELAILQRTVGGGGHFVFSMGDKPGLREEIVAFACLNYLARQDSGALTMSLRRLAHERGSPGRIFKLTEAALGSTLERSAQFAEGFAIARLAGVAQLVCEGDPAQLASRVLSDCYTRVGGRR